MQEMGVGGGRLRGLQLQFGFVKNSSSFNEATWAVTKIGLHDNLFAQAREVILNQRENQMRICWLGSMGTGLMCFWNETSGDTPRLKKNSIYKFFSTNVSASLF